MKKASKIFIIIGMIVGCVAILPIIFGVLALKKLEEAKTASELTTMGVLVLLFCSLIGGILMLCIKDQDLVENQNH